MKFLTGRFLTPAVFFSLFLFILILMLLSDGFSGGGDSIAHYRISHFAFKYPHLFLDHWGKPVFTFLSSPFSQIGFNGIRLYNIIAGLFTAYITYLTAKSLKKDNSLLIIFFVLFAPIYFELFFSGLTEITFSLVLILSVFYSLKRKYTLSAIILSFLPFVRSEGFLILIIFLFAFILLKKYKSIPFLLSGFFLLSLAGWSYYHDFFWLINKMPYNGASEIYGHGELFHFVKSLPHIMGYPILILFILGVIALILQLRKSKKIEDLSWQEFLFVLLPFLAYFSAHTFVWWRGLGSSLGLLRVMAGVLPLAAIISLDGYNMIYQSLRRFIYMKYILPTLIILIVIYIPFTWQKYPMKLGDQEKTLASAAGWVKETPFFKNKIFYYDLFFQFKLGIDPYDTDRCFERVPERNNPEKGIMPGSLVQWDAHYGPNEGGMPLERLLNNENFTLLNKFEPEYPLVVLGDNNYAVYIFKRN